MIGLTAPSPEQFIWPIFVVEGSNVEDPIESLPGQFYYSTDRISAALEPVVQSGIGGVMVFGMIPDENKTPDGRFAWREEGLVQRSVRKIKHDFPDLTVFTDVGLSGYTTHGQNGVLDEQGKVINDESVRLLRKVALSHARAGADAVGPSAMMDGQIQAIRRGLDEGGFQQTILLSYSTKFASNMYDPFPYATHSPPGKETRKTYMAPVNDTRQALREASLDEQEGADILMVKPSLFYLDIVAKTRAATNLPLAAYNVSGEYSMLTATADRGWGDLDALVKESITAVFRAGADLLISYWANQYERIFDAN